MSSGLEARAARLPREVRYAVCRRFLVEKMSASEVAESIKSDPELAAQLNVKVSRELVYPIVALGREEGFFELYAPFADDLVRDVSRVFGVVRPDIASVRPIQVVDFRGEHTPIEVINRAAQSALDLIRGIALTKQEQAERAGLDWRSVEVHVGFASGATTSRVARKLAEEIRRDPSRVPALTLHATSSGFDETEPGLASSTFFNLFADLPIKMKYVSMFAPTYVESKNYDAATQTPGARVAFDRRGEIDLVISALARAKDEHGELLRFIKFLSAAQAQQDQYARAERTRSRGRKVQARKREAPKISFPSAEEFRQSLDAAGWVGDVNFRPFSPEKPITGDVVKFMPLTLFGIQALVDRLQIRGKTMLLVAGPCGSCGTSRADALFHLMRNPKLKVWTHVVMDSQTARRLLELDDEWRERL